MMVAALGRQIEEMSQRNARQAVVDGEAPLPGRSERDGRLAVRSLRQSEEQGRRFYDGDVRIVLGDLSIGCQHFQREVPPADSEFRLAGYGGVVVQGVPGFSLLKADQFNYDSRHGGLLTLAGDVRVDGPAGQKKYRLLSLALEDRGLARIAKARSLLDDLAESQTLARKLALMQDITVVYRDDELPPEASWLLAMKLLDPHLIWRGAGSREQGRKAGYSRSGSGEKGEVLAQQVGGEREQGRSDRSDGLVGSVRSPDSQSAWPEAHTGEPWMREEPGYWRLDQRRHVDVLRAVKLLSRPGADAADNERRKRWLTEIERNNTVLRVAVEASYLPKQDAVVTLDVRNADRIVLRLYGVGNGAAWAAVRQRLGGDFIYAGDKARFSGGAPAKAGPKKLNDLMENLVAEWIAHAGKLPCNESWARQHAAPTGETSWCGNRKLVIPAESLAKPGYYVLAVEANGETAFAPIRVENRE